MTPVLKQALAHAIRIANGMDIHEAAIMYRYGEHGKPLPISTLKSRLKKPPKPEADEDGLDLSTHIDIGEAERELAAWVKDSARTGFRSPSSQC